MMLTTKQRLNKTFTYYSLALLVSLIVTFVLSIVASIEENDVILVFDVILGYMILLAITSILKKWSGKTVFKNKKDFYRKVAAAIGSAIFFVTSFFYSITYAISGGGFVINKTGLSFTWLFVEIYFAVWIITYVVVQVALHFIIKDN